MFFDDVPQDNEDDNFGGWRSDDEPTGPLETAPLGGGPIGK